MKLFLEALRESLPVRTLAERVKEYTGEPRISGKPRSAAQLPAATETVDFERLLQDPNLMDDKWVERLDPRRREALIEEVVAVMDKLTNYLAQYNRIKTSVCRVTR